MGAWNRGDERKRRRLVGVVIPLIGMLAGCGDDVRGETDLSTSSGGTTTGAGSTSLSTSVTATTTAGPTTAGTTSAGTTAGATDTTMGSTGDDAVTIYEIQDGTIAEGTDVVVDAVIVTGLRTTGFFAQEPAGGPNSGVWVFTGDPGTGPDITGLSVGDEVDFAGQVTEFFEFTEVDAQGGMVMATGGGGALSPEVVPLADLTAAATAEQWEGVLVQVAGMPLTVSALPGQAEFEVNDGANALVIDDFLYDAPADTGNFPGFAVGASFTSITGPLNFSFDAYKIAARDSLDLAGYIGPPMGFPVDGLLPGDLIVTEIMYDSNAPGCDDSCEWIEIFNNTNLAVDLDTLVIQDSNLGGGGLEGTVSGATLVQPMSYAVLGRNSAGTWTYDDLPDAFYGPNPAFNNSGGGDFALIRNATDILDQTATYSGQGALDNGVSWKLDPAMIDAVLNDNAMAWCWSTMAFDTTGDLGSPGAANEAACNPAL